MTKLNAIGNHIVVEPIVKPAQEKTSDGIILPEKKEAYPNRGVVISVGNKVESHIAVGYKIVFRRFEGVEIKIDDKLYLAVEEKDVYAVINEE